MSVYSDNVEISNFKPNRCKNCGAKICSQAKTDLCKKCFNRQRWFEHVRKKFGAKIPLLPKALHNVEQKQEVIQE